MGWHRQNSPTALLCCAGTSLPYPRSTFGLEFASVLLFFLVDGTRITSGSAGNRSERMAPLLLMIILSVPLLAYYIYFLGFQVYVYAPCLP